VSNKEAGWRPNRKKTMLNSVTPDDAAQAAARNFPDHTYV